MDLGLKSKNALITGGSHGIGFKPEEIGSLAAYLVFEQSSYMTGATVESCGGPAKSI